MSKPPATDKEILILYIEDREDLLRDTLAHIRSRYSPECVGVKSRQEAVRLLKRGEIKPHLALLDCQPLNMASDERASMEAGDLLYAQFAREGIPVVLLTGLEEDQVLARSAYQSQRPLAFLSKPFTERDLDLAIEKYRQLAEKEGTP